MAVKEWILCCDKPESEKRGGLAPDGKIEMPSTNHGCSNIFIIMVHPWDGGIAQG